MRGNPDGRAFGNYLTPQHSERRQKPGSEHCLIIIDGFLETFKGSGSSWKLRQWENQARAPDRDRIMSIGFSCLSKGNNGRITVESSAIKLPLTLESKAIPMDAQHRMTAREQQARWGDAAISGDGDARVRSSPMTFRAKMYSVDQMELLGPTGRLPARPRCAAACHAVESRTRKG